MPSTAPAPRRSHDLSWNRRDLVALTVLCAAAWAAIGPQAFRDAGADPAAPPDPQRVRMAAERINPNSATAASLRRLPSIGPARAAAILDFRHSHRASPFRSPADLTRIPGIGPGIVDTITPYLTFPPPP